MYGGVATPLALLHHSDINGRTKQHNALQYRSNSKEEGYSGVRNALRLPPLRETGHRDILGGGCENEPLLPPMIAPKPMRNGKKQLSLDEGMSAPPLPPHKNHFHQIPRQFSQDSKYAPPWPRGTCMNSSYTNVPGISSVSRNVVIDNIKPYLKPLPKPPGKESPSRHRKHISGKIFMSRISIIYLEKA